MAGNSQLQCILLKDPDKSRSSYRNLTESDIMAPCSPSPPRSSGATTSLVRLVDASPLISVNSVKDINDNSTSEKSSACHGKGLRFIQRFEESLQGLRRDFTQHGMSREVGSVSTLSARSRRVSTGYCSPTASADELSGVRRPRLLSFQRGKVVGSGGFGTVYQAILSDGALAAVKEMKMETNFKTIDREVRALSSLPPHPHCVRYLGSRHSRRHYYIIMEYISGGSIQSLRATVGRFKEPVVQRYARMVLLGLQHLHRHGIIHRDIKGANVLLDEKGSVKIVDFGCCKDFNNAHTTLGSGGTPLWMAPEVCRGEAASEKSDVWAVGCLCLEMSNETGLPWRFPDSVNLQGVSYAIASAKKLPDIPADLSLHAQNFISCCLQIDPNDRLGVDELLQHSFFFQDHTAHDLGEDELLFSREPSTDVTHMAQSWTLRVGDSNATVSNSSRVSSRLKRKNDTKESLLKLREDQFRSVNHGFRLESASDDDDDDDNNDDRKKTTIRAGKVSISNVVVSPLIEQTIPPWLYGGTSETEDNALEDVLRLPSTASLTSQCESKKPLVHQFQQQGPEQRLCGILQTHMEPEINSPGIPVGFSPQNFHGAGRIRSPVVPPQRPLSLFSPRESGVAITPTQIGNSRDLASSPIRWASAGTDNVITQKKSHRP